jgi:hypothetical protein
MGFLCSLFVFGIVHVSLRKSESKEEVIAETEMVIEYEMEEVAEAPAVVEEPVAAKVEVIAEPVVVVEVAPAPLPEVVKVEVTPAPLPEVVKVEVAPAPVVEVAPAPVAEVVKVEIAPVPPAPLPEVVAAAPAKKEKAPPQPVEPSCDKPCAPAAKKCVKPAKPKAACKPCAAPPVCCWKFNPCNPKGCSDMNCGGYFVSFDLLIWAAENRGFSYAFELDDSPALSGSVVRLDPSWDPGFRIGLGWNTSYNFWDLFVGYTWYRNHAAKTRSDDIGFIDLRPIATTDSETFEKVSASAIMNMNMIDLELGRLIYLTKVVAIRPFAGLKGGSLNQSFKDHFTDPLSDDPTNSETKFSGKNNYWGIGPRLGLNGEWHLDWGVSILGKFASALLYGGTHASSLSRYMLASETAFTTDTYYKDEFSQLVPNLQMALGLQWQTCFHCEKMFYKMSLSWESNYWWDQFNLPYGSTSTAPMPSVNNQPLSTEGFTINAEWDF